MTILSWKEAFAAGPARCGGKGWNLARLARYGFKVPAGGVLTVDSYEWVLSPAGDGVGSPTAGHADRGTGCD